MTHDRDEIERVEPLMCLSLTDREFVRRIVASATKAFSDALDRGRDHTSDHE